MVGFSPIFQSAESWIIAEQLSKTNSRIDVGVTIGARCVATVIASQLPVPDKQMQPVLMRHLKIEEPHISSLYPENFDSALRYTLRLVKRLELKHAAQEQQDEFNKLLNRIYEVAEQSSERASSNARQLLVELFGSLPGPQLQHMDVHGPASLVPCCLMAQLFYHVPTTHTPQWILLRLRMSP